MIACKRCQNVDRQVKAGKTNAGSQMYKCRKCGKRWTYKPKRTKKEFTAAERANAIHFWHSVLSGISLLLGLYDNLLALMLYDKDKKAIMLETGLAIEHPDYEDHGFFVFNKQELYEQLKPLAAAALLKVGFNKLQIRWIISLALPMRLTVNIIDMKRWKYPRAKINIQNLLRAEAERHKMDSYVMSADETRAALNVYSKDDLTRGIVEGLLKGYEKAHPLIFEVTMLDSANYMAAKWMVEDRNRNGDSAYQHRIDVLEELLNQRVQVHYEHYKSLPEVF